MDSLHTPHGMALRKGRVSLPNQIYHITAATTDRAPVFHDLYAARILVTAFHAEETRHRSQTLAYVVMPDHFHWLMQLNEGVVLAKVVGAVKSVCAHRVGREIRQRVYHDHALRRDEDMQRTARYIVSNPLRAGLVTRLEDYPHWDAIWLP